MRHKIRERRIELGMTQAELAEKAGCSRQFINALESDPGMQVRSNLLLNIAEALNCTLNDLFYAESV